MSVKIQWTPMTETNTEETEDEGFDPRVPEHREIGRKIVDESGGLDSAMAHLYRGEMERVTTWRRRLDQTTYWAVTLMVAILVWAFSIGDAPHAILLVGMATVGVFLWIEARRYLGYDIWRSRVRILQENLFAYALDPSRELTYENWRGKLAENLYRPSTKLTLTQAVAHRLRRVYFPLLGILLVAWFGKITVYTPGESWAQTAAIGSFPGPLVVLIVGLVYIGLFGLMMIPSNRHIRGEIYGEDVGFWEQ